VCYGRPGDGFTWTTHKTATGEIVLIICLEGIDACGKATQSRLLANAFGDHAAVESFPAYWTPTGTAIEEHLKGQWSAGSLCVPGSSDYDPLVFQALQTVNRFERARFIEGAIAIGQTLILDRYWPSGVVYGEIDGLPRQWLIDIHVFLPQPDVFILLDIPPEESFERRPERRDRYEQSKDRMHDAVLKYRQLWNAFERDPFLSGDSRWFTVPGTGPVGAVHERILAVCMSLQSRFIQSENELL
jgi:dTMP kinase